MSTKSDTISAAVSRIERAPNMSRVIDAYDAAVGGSDVSVSRHRGQWQISHAGFAGVCGDFWNVRARLAADAEDFLERAAEAKAAVETDQAPALETVAQPCQQQADADADAGSVHSEVAIEAEPVPQPEEEAEIEPSFSYSLGRLDRRCRGWERVIRESVSLPMPEDVHRAGDLPGAYAPDRGSEELFGLDAVMQGEENHHRKARGWSFWLHVRNPATGELATMKPSAARKAVIKDAIRAGRIDLPREILKGAGDIAAMVRMVAAIRAGLPIAELLAAGD